MSRKQGIFITIFGVFLLSFESFCIRLADVAPLSFSFFLGIMMFSSLIFYAKYKYQNITKLLKSNYKFFYTCSVCFALSNISFIGALDKTSVANTVIILASSPLISAVFNYVFYKSKTDINIYISSFFILIGLFVIFGGEKSGSSGTIGNLLALASAITFTAAYVVLARHKEANIIVCASIGGLLTSVFCLFFSPTLHVASNSFLIIVFMGIAISPLAKVLIGVGAKIINSSEMCIILVLESVFAPIWAWLWFKELPTQNTFIGGFIILSTIILNSLYTIKINKKTKQT